MDLSRYKKALADPGSVGGDDALHRQGFVAAYGQTSLDNDWNTYAEKVFGHGADFAEEIKAYPSMQQKTRQMIEIYGSFAPAFQAYFKLTGLDAVAAVP